MLLHKDLYACVRRHRSFDSTFMAVVDFYFALLLRMFKKIYKSESLRWYKMILKLNGSRELVHIDRLGKC